MLSSVLSVTERLRQVGFLLIFSSLSASFRSLHRIFSVSPLCLLAYPCLYTGFGMVSTTGGVPARFLRRQHASPRIRGAGAIAPSTHAAWLSGYALASPP